MQLAEAGMNVEAADFFYNSLVKNKNNVDARIGLKSIGQKVLDGHLQNFYQAHGADNHKEAVYSYLKAVAYKKKCENFVQLSIPPYYEDYFSESKGVFLEDRYIDAKKLIKEEKFDEANKILEEILRIDKNYKDVVELEKYSDAEPIYRRAMNNYDAKKYRTAYYQFKEVLSISTNYKDADYYKEEALKKGRLTIAILPFTGTNLDQQTAEVMYNSVIQELVALNNPFIVVIDRKNTDLIITEQKMALSGVLDQNTAAETGKLLGAKAVLSGSSIGTEYKEIAPKKVEQRGYNKIVERKYDKVKDSYYTVTRYTKTTYFKVEGQRSVAANIQVNLISSETGQVLLNEVYNPVITDRLLYAEKNGSWANLYSGYWKYKLLPSKEDIIHTNSRAKRELDAMFRERRRTLKTKSQLLKELSDDVSSKIARKIKIYEESRE